MKPSTVRAMPLLCRLQNKSYDIRLVYTGMPTYSHRHVLAAGYADANFSGQICDCDWRIIVPIESSICYVPPLASYTKCIALVQEEFYPFQIHVSKLEFSYH